jgi:hypothetical protein
LDSVKSELKASAKSNEGMPTDTDLEKAAAKIERFNNSHTKLFDKFNMRPISKRDLKKILTGFRYSEKRKEFIIGEAGIDQVK